MPRAKSRARCASDEAPMIGAVLGLALQIGAAGGTLNVVVSGQTVRVPTLPSANGPMVTAAALARVMPIHVTRDSASWYTVEVWGGRIQVESGASSIRIGSDIRQLVTAPVVRNGTLHMPLQMISEVFPRVMPNTRWDADNARLVLMTGMIPSNASSVGSTADIRQSG